MHAVAALDREAWDRIIRQHHHRVVVSLIALGLAPAQAHDIANAAWARLFEKHVAGELDALEFPGLAITQARYLAVDMLRRTKREARRVAGLDAIRETAPPPVDVPRLSDEELARVKRELAACSPNAQRVFRMVYARPRRRHDDIARELGLSTQRVRQLLCEVRARLRDTLENP